MRFTNGSFKLELEATHRRILQRQKEYDRRHPRDALCAPISAPAAHLTRPNSANRCTALERRKARDEEKRGEARRSEEKRGEARRSRRKHRRFCRAGAVTTARSAGGFRDGG